MYSLPSASKEAKQLELAFIAIGNTKLYNNYAGKFHIKLNILLLYDPIIPLLIFCPGEMKYFAHVKTVHECL